MSAQRKPDHLIGGYKMAYLSSRARYLSGDEFKVLFLMVDHIGEKGCYPSQDTLAQESGYSQTKVRRLRDRLAEKGEIGFVAGGGRTATYYSIPGLLEHTAEMRGKKAPRVPDSPVEGATQGGTEPMNPSINRKTAAPDLKIVPSKGWDALCYRAPQILRDCWLPHVTLVSEDPDGVRLKATKSFHADRIRKELAPGGALYEIARAVGIEPEKVTIEGPNHAPVQNQPPVMPVTAQGLNEVADRIEQQSDSLRIERVDKSPLPADGKVTSLAAYRTKHQNLDGESP
jgi:hypothetical protein